jgi:Na+/H+ antiporter NhaD/arsenite permease-like protein
VISSRSGLSYNDFLFHLAPFVMVLLIVFIALCRWLFRSALVYRPDRASAVMALRARDAIQDTRLLVISLSVLTVVTAAFVLHTVLDLEPAVIALIGGLGLLVVSRLDKVEVAKDVEWPTLIFFAGLFVMVGGLVHTGVIKHISEATVDSMQGRLFLTALILLVGSALLSAVVDNIPYVVTVSPIVAQLAADYGDPDKSNVLWWALALGADLGGNATAVGASATVVILGMAERAGKPISFWEFTKYGLIVTAVSIILAVPYLWLRYFAG